MIGSITAYLDYLKSIGLRVTVHFCDAALHRLPPQRFAPLLPYNAHTHPYCMAVKRDGHARCRAHQQALIAAGEQAGFCRDCHAGVREYLYPLRHEGQGIGILAVSGDRGAGGAAASLSAEDPPASLCGVLLPPLALLLEQYFERAAGEPCHEFNRIRQ